MKTLEQRLSQARMTLLLDFPFFGQLALRMTPEIDSSIETACTDGRRIRFNPDFCDRLPDKQLTWLYAHEVAHPALGHLWRFGQRDPELVNVAADFVVNEMLETVLAQPGASHRMERIPTALLDRKYFGMSMEQIYSHLRQNAKPAPQPQAGSASQGGSPSQGASPKPLGTFTKPAPPPSADGKPGEDGQDGDSSDGSGHGAPSPSPITSGEDALQQEWKQAAAQAATVARSRARGQMPAAIEDLLRDLFEPEVPWQDLLRQFASRVCRDDYSFRRPNRRYAHRGIMLPTLRTEGLGRIVVAVDTSGSIRSNEGLLTTFLSELQSILDTTHPEVMHLLDCDARVHSHSELHSGDHLAGTRFRGGGGTDFRPVFTFTEDQQLQPDCLIFFTDLEGPFPQVPPPYPVMWLNYGNARLKAPFGETLHIRSHDL